MAIGRAVISNDTAETIFSRDGEVISGVNLNSELPLFKIVKEGAGSFTTTTNFEFPSFTISHGLGYIPNVLFWLQRVPGDRMRLVTNPGFDLTYILTDDTVTALSYSVSETDISVFITTFSAGNESIGTYKYYYAIFWDPIEDI